MKDLQQFTDDYSTINSSFLSRKVFSFILPLSFIVFDSRSLSSCIISHKEAHKKSHLNLECKTMHHDHRKKKEIKRKTRAFVSETHQQLSIIVQDCRLQLFPREQYTSRCSIHCSAAVLPLSSTQIDLSDFNKR